MLVWTRHVPDTLGGRGAQDSLAAPYNTAGARDGHENDNLLPPGSLAGGGGTPGAQRHRYRDRGQGISFFFFSFSATRTDPSHKQHGGIPYQERVLEQIRRHAAINARGGARFEKCCLCDSANPESKQRERETTESHAAATAGGGEIALAVVCGV